MVTLEKDELAFRYPEVHPEARLKVSFQRTLRVPDDGREYPLPAGFGRFPIRHVEDYADRLPPTVRRRGGVIMPLHQAEALWIHFSAPWPAAIKVGTGKICAVTGEPWRSELSREPEQNYVAAPDQPWLDGYAVEKGVVRQFVAMPLGEGITAEEQITGKAEWGGIQLKAFPLRREQWEKEQRDREQWEWHDKAGPASYMPVVEESVGIAPGGQIRQEIYADDRPLAHWDQLSPARAFVHLLNSRDWTRVTGEVPPPSPISRETYDAHGVPWFDHYREDLEAVEGGSGLQGIQSVLDLLKSAKGKGKGGGPGPVIQTGPHTRPRRVRSAEF